MKLYTWAEIKSRVIDDMDLYGEDFIDADELLNAANQAIDEAEQHVITLYEDYFLTSAEIDLVSGQKDYDLPTDIYAQKIRKLIYDNGAKKYVISRVKSLEETLYIDSTYDYYKYLMMSQVGAQAKVRLFPAAKETAAGVVTIWYIRNANRFVDDTSVLDIPESYNFIVQKLKDLVAQKERGLPDGDASPNLRRERKLLVETLSTMVPDGDDTIEADLELYFDQMCDYEV